MRRTLTATTGVLLALAVALSACGKDDNSSDATAKNGATTTTPSVITTTGKAAAAVAKAKSKIATATTDALPSTSQKSGAGDSKSSASAAGTAGAGSAAAKKQAAKKKTASGSGSPGSSGSDLTSGTGGGPIGEREDALAVLQRYYKAFIVRDPSTVCSLLTDAGHTVMIGDGNAKTCEASAKKLMDQASAANVELLQRTRDGLHADDIKVTGDLATAQIGKTTALHMIQANGRWLVRSPNVVETQ